MSYLEYADKYLPGEVYRSTYGDTAALNPFYKVLSKGRKNVKFTPSDDDTTTMDSESFQRFLNLQRNPSSLYLEAVRYPKGFVEYMNLTSEFGLNPGSV